MKEEFIIVDFNRKNKRGVVGVTTDELVCMVHHNSVNHPNFNSVWKCQIVEDKGKYLFVDPIIEL